MFVRFVSFSFASLSVALLFQSCGNETKNNSLTLVGRWELVRGFRNQKPTETLAGTYFQFGNDGNMKTNLPVTAEEPVPYEVYRNEIRQKSAPSVKYDIRELTDSTLILNLELRGMLFEMHLRRAPKSPSPESSAPNTNEASDSPAPSIADSTAQK